MTDFSHLLMCLRLDQRLASEYGGAHRSSNHAVEELGFSSEAVCHREGVSHPLVPGGTLACGRGGVRSQFGRGDRHCGTLGIYVYFVVQTIEKSMYLLSMCTTQRGLNTKRPKIVFFLGPTKPLTSYD